MKKKLIAVLLTLFVIILSSCGSENNVSYDNTNFTITGSENSYCYDTSLGTYILNLPGEYHLSGSLIGAIEVSKELESKVILYFDGVTIESNKECILYASPSSKLEIVLSDGTNNYLKTNNEDKEYNTIQSENNLMIRGNGSLWIENNSKNGIGASEFTISSGNLKINASKKDAIHAKAIFILGGKLDLCAKGDIFEAECNSKGNKGTITISNTTIIASDAKFLCNANGGVSFIGDLAITITITNIESLFGDSSYEVLATNISIKKDNQDYSL